MITQVHVKYFDNFNINRTRYEKYAYSALLPLRREILPQKLGIKNRTRNMQILDLSLRMKQQFSIK